MSKRTTTLRAALLAATTLALVGAASGAARAAGTLMWGMPAETDILDPHATGGWSTYQVTYQIFEGLVKEDLTKADVPTPPLVPGLATSWEISPDGTVYTFKLRPGVKFHDGTPFDAAAVKFNFERFWDESSPNFYKKAKAFVIAYTKWIKSVEVVDPMTVRVTLKAPNYQWLRIGLQSYGQPLMVSPAAVKKYGNDGIALHPIGTGPFRFVERDQGVKTVLERNPDYWGKPAKLDRIIFRPLQDPATRVNALENGEIQMMSTPPWDEIQRLVGEGFKLSTNPNVPYINFLHLNFKNRRHARTFASARRSTWRSTARASRARSITAPAAPNTACSRPAPTPTIRTSRATATIPKVRRSCSRRRAMRTTSSSCSSCRSTAPAKWSRPGSSAT